MGNSSTKESRPPSSLGHPSSNNNGRHPSSPTTAGASNSSHSTNDRSITAMYSARPARHSRPDLSFLGIGHSSERDQPSVETRRETKAEREARRLERERALREKERERSMREEGVDGGYLVTLGTYTGTEDFSKPIVRQLMVSSVLQQTWRMGTHFTSRSIDGLLLSGEASTTTQIHGQSINSLPLPKGSLFLHLMIYRQMSLLLLRLVRSQIRDPPILTFTTSPFPSLDDHSLLHQKDR
jgi:hypothetical protein